MIIIFLGAPGSGKGTVSTVLCEEHGFKHISTGDLFRENIKLKTPLGQEVEEVMKSGKLVTDELTNNLLVDVLENKYDLSKDNFIFDGYPRTLPQVDFLEKYAKQHNITIKKVIYFEIDEKTLIERISGRRVCPKCGATYHQTFLPPKNPNHCDNDGTLLIQREDDKEDKVKIRLKTFSELTEPLIQTYRNKNLLVTFDASQKSEEIAKEIIPFIN